MPKAPRKTRRSSPLAARLIRAKELAAKFAPVPREWLEVSNKSNRDTLDSLGLVTLASVAPKEFEWLWQYRVPRRGSTVLAGEGDVGKTFLAIDLASRVAEELLSGGAIKLHSL